MPKVILSITNVHNIYNIHKLGFATKSFLVVLLSLIASASLAGLFVFSTHATTIDYNVNVEPALNVTIPTDTISLLLDPTNKTFSSQELNISVGTNNPYGYRLTMSSTGTSLVHTEDSNYTIPTLPTLAGGYTDESFIVDKWGYKQDSSSWNSYTSGTTILESNTPVNNDNTELSFGAKIDYNQAPGNYTLVLNFNAVAKVATNDLTFTFAGEGVEGVKVCTVAGDCTGDNLVGIVTTSGGSVPALEDGSTYYLYPVFTSGYEFVSWEKTSEAGTISATDILNPTFTMSDEPASVTVTGNKIYIQDFTNEMCSAQASSSAVTVYDKRDENSYTVRYINGNCWMTQNLRFSGSDIDSTNTNINTTKTISWGDLTAGNSYDAARYHNSGNTTNGYWYNYAGASAMTITGSSNSTNATYDICPKNWRLPTDSEFSGITSSSSAFSPVTGGYYSNGSIYYTGYGYWWSATAYNSTHRYGLSWNGSSLDTGGNSRYAGFYVRCIRKSIIDDATYMQDVTAEMVANTAEGATAILRDKRDEQDYTVAKINGNLWMTQNLRFSGSTIDSTNTNINTTKTISWGDLTAGQSWDVARYHNSGNTTNGYWYNYAGASAMTITGSSNQNTQTYDICPKNWRLPTLNEFSGITSQATAFSPVTGGNYYGGSIYNTGLGYWWSATAYDSTYRYLLAWNGSSLSTRYDGLRGSGFYVRCIRSS